MKRDYRIGIKSEIMNIKNCLYDIAALFPYAFLIHYYNDLQIVVANSLHALVYNSLTYMESNRQNHKFCH